MITGKEKGSNQNRFIWRLLILFLFFVFCLPQSFTVLGQTDSNQVPAGKSLCQVQDHILVSRARNKTTHYLAFIPEGNPGAKYPLLLLLHGAWDDYQAWNQHAGSKLCELTAAYKIIIVTPDGDPFGWYADSPFLKNNQIETYFIDELIPHLKKDLPVNGAMGIAGLSMGGHGALFLAIKHPGIFRSAGSMSGIVDITRHQNQFKLKEVFGSYETNTELWRDHAILNLAGLHMEDLKKLPLLITVSQDDPWALGENLDLHQRLEGLGVRHEFRVDSGAHDWAYWLKSLPGQVDFHAKYLH